MSFKYQLKIKTLFCGAAIAALQDLKKELEGKKTSQNLIILDLLKEELYLRGIE